ncbi:MAG: hypothetical protein AAF716_17875 [Cyanobacteria bacterium P01_D01_bin.1]
MTPPSTELETTDKLDTKAVIETRDAIAVNSPSAGGRRRSPLRWIGNTIARYPNFIQLVLTLVLLTGTSSFLLYRLFRDAWSPDKDNQAILETIATMEFERKNVLPIENSSSEQVVTRSYVDLDPYLAAQGWMWINRFGSTITYGRNDERLIASCSTYSPLYLVCNLSEIP